MVKDGIHIFTWLNTRVIINVSFLGLPVFFMLPAIVNGEFGGAAKTMWMITVVFTSILLHEFGHILAARKLGMETHDITLTFIGGVAEIERNFKRGMHEILVALAGPAVNLVLVILFGPAYFILSAMGYAETTIFKIVTDIFMINTILGLFNLLPLFPMDGGRVVRGAFSELMSMPNATRAVVIPGFFIGFAMVVAGYNMNLYGMILIGLIMPITGAIELRHVNREHSLSSNISLEKTCST